MSEHQLKVWAAYLRKVGVKVFAEWMAASGYPLETALAVVREVRK